MGGPTCGENGSGTVNWLLSVNKSAGTVVTGGAPYSSDPFVKGYCYVDSTIASTAVSPVTLAATWSGSTFSTSPASATLYLPLFSSQTDYNDVTFLPIRGLSFQNVTVSADDNCIGTVNNDSLQAGSCTDGDPAGPQSCSRWRTAGSLGGYITLADANKVNVIQLDETLYALLTSMHSNGKCPASALTTGDYCSKTLMPGGCQDSVWISASFAASA